MKLCLSGSVSILSDCDSVLYMHFVGIFQEKPVCLKKDLQRSRKRMLLCQNHVLFNKLESMAYNYVN